MPSSEDEALDLLQQLAVRLDDLIVDQPDVPEFETVLEQVETIIDLFVNPSQTDSINAMNIDSSQITYNVNANALTLYAPNHLITYNTTI